MHAFMHAWHGNLMQEDVEHRRRREWRCISLSCGYVGVGRVWNRRGGDIFLTNIDDHGGGIVGSIQTFPSSSSSIIDVN